VEKSVEDMKSKSHDYKEESILEKLLKIDKNVAVVMSTDSILAGVDTVCNFFFSKKCNEYVLIFCTDFFGIHWNYLLLGKKPKQTRQIERGIAKYFSEFNR
jgi:hypothetical protein